MAIDRTLDKDDVKPGRPRRVTWWKFLIASIASTAVLIGGTCVYALWEGSSLLNQELSQARSVGMPLSSSDFVDGVAVPDSQNSALLLHPLLLDLANTYDSRRIKVAPSASGALESEYLEMLTEWEPKLSKTVAALRTGSFVPKVDLSSAPCFDYDLYRGVKECAALLVLRARRLADEGKVAEAFETLEAVMTLAEGTATTPAVYTYLVRNSVEEAVFHGIERILLAHPTRPVLAEVAKFAKRKRAKFDLKKALAGELIAERALLHHVKEGGKIEDYWGTTQMTLEDRWALTTMFSFAFRDGYEARKVRIWRIGYAAMPTDPVDPKAAKAAYNKMESIPHTESWLYGSAMKYAGFYAGFDKLPFEAEARTRLLRAAVQRLSGGTITHSDPFGGKSFLIVKNKDRDVIYSVGDNASDNRGDLQRDIPFEVRKSSR